jgi:hypothetical protein
MADTIKIDDGKLLFELSGKDELLAVKRSISVPLEHVVSVSTDKVSWKPFRQLKMGGSGFPGLIKDGRFLDGDGRMMFFEMRHPEKCVTVNLNHERYKAIVFEVADKEEAARMIQDALDLRK